MDRRQQLFQTKRDSGIDPSLIPTHVNFQHRKGDPRRKKGELRQLSLEEKALCALRKVLAQMSADSRGHQRFFVTGAHCRILDRHASPGAKSHEPGSYRVKGRCQIGVAHKGGGSSLKMIEFLVSFRDVKDSMGLPDVAYFDPTTVDEIAPAAPL